MKLQNKFLILFFLSLSLFGQELSLQDAINIALQKNNRIKQYEEKLSQKEFDDLSALGNFLPKIDLKASYTHLNDDLSLNLNPIRTAIIGMQAGTQTEIANLRNIITNGSPLSNETKTALNSQFQSNLGSLFPDLNMTFKEQNYLTGSFQVVQPLFLGGKLVAGKNFSKAELEASKSELRKVQNEVIVEVINNYLNVLLLDELVQTRVDVLNGIQKHSQQAERLLKEGVIANHDVLRAKVALAETEINLEDDKSKLRLARIAFNNSIGLDDNSEIILTDRLNPTSSNINRDSLLTLAYQTQPILQLLNHKQTAAAQKYNVARSSFLPQVAAFGKYEMYPQYLSVLEPRWAIGLQMNFSIFNGLKDYMELQSAQHLENEVKYMQADMHKKITLWINKAFLDVNNAQSRFNKLESALDLAKESLRLNERRFETGIGTSLEVIDAQLSLENIEIQRLVSLKNYYQSLSDLYLAAGTPLEILKVWNKAEQI